MVQYETCTYVTSCGKKPPILSGPALTASHLSYGHADKLLNWYNLSL